MKNSMINLLRGGVFLLAMVMAFAFTQPSAIIGQYGQSGGTWYDVTNEDPGMDTYTCDQQTDAECLFDAAHGAGSPINPGEDKVFVKRGDLEEAD
ncbi:hypothetical protein [Echinicola shivajiensis]|uniref:hypothetical protein n=1 Tax=Echinicola shivajiensis TaxID=1035916 RepID=UPI001BFC0639|nr:hypothetical protein [Echinicola shivajiensis]